MPVIWSHFMQHRCDASVMKLEHAAVKAVANGNYLAAVEAVEANVKIR